MNAFKISRRTALALAGMAGYAARAESWPARPVQLIVPSSPGGAISDVADILAGALSQRWRQPVKLDHIPGDGMVNAFFAVAKGRPDGYCLGLATTALTINAALRQGLPYSTLTDLTPISELTEFQYGIFANRKIPVHSVAELIAFCKKARAPVEYASPGIGTGPHLAFESFAYEAGIKVAHIPFESYAPAKTAVLEGKIPFLAVGVNSSIEAALKGPLQLVALMGQKPVTHAAPASWISDAIAGFEHHGHIGVMAPRGLPARLIHSIGADFTAVVKRMDVGATLASIGMESTGTSSSEYDTQLRTEIAQWKLVSRVTGIKI